MKAAEGLHNQDQLIQDILNTAPDGLARSHCALLRISPVVAKTPDTCIRDSLAFFEELDLGGWDAKEIMAACLKMVDFTFDPGNIRLTWREYLICALSWSPAGDVSLTWPALTSRQELSRFKR
ncbi:hypothetical protein CAPTEDRAFT_187155 [Capitella teleta]|uniref:Uncharacterized protein n=1 Tax=Capitella teleta TaxID=283909 RepID=R7UGQ8_CAPTE|nr:hypothetical protein CAPTEDRAFT_187155 [Capitella teleta]|eukprot:ELU02963.1 hypothetical protein CAPTEDRAFT_187155 [Capitella teleta]